MSLHAPWRMEYIRSLNKGAGGAGASGAGGTGGGGGACFLCEAAGAEEGRWEELLVLLRSERTLVMLNRFPYANGHLLVAPVRHVAEIEDLTAEELMDLGVQTQRAVALLRTAVSAQGFNIGINLGRVAGAGVPGHLHQHIVPRWGGDLNFMGVVAEVQVIPEALSLLHKEMRRLLAGGK